MTSSGKTAIQALAESPLAGLLDQARKLDRISSLVADFSRDIAGDNPAPSPHCAIRERQVVISVATSSQAAKLRQRTASLTRLLQDCDPQLTGFRIHVQPGATVNYTAEPVASGRSGQPSPEVLRAALLFAEDLGRNLHDSPLRDAALRLRALLLKRTGRRG